MKNVNYVHLTTLNTFNKVERVVFDCQKVPQKGRESGVVHGWERGGVHMLWWGRGSQAGLGEELTCWGAEGVHMLGWGGAHMLGWGRSAHAGVRKGFTCWGVGGVHMLGWGRCSHAGVREGFTCWGGEGDHRLEWFESDLWWGNKEKLTLMAASANQLRGRAYNTVIPPRQSQTPSQSSVLYFCKEKKS